MDLSFLVPKLAALGAGLLVYYLARQGVKPAAADPLSGERILRYPWMYQALGWGVLGLAAAIVGGSLFSSEAAANPRLKVVGLAVAGFFAVVSLYTIVDANATRIVLSDETMTYHSPWRLPRTLAWTDVADVSYQDQKQMFVVKGSGGEVFRVSTMFLGTRDLANTLRGKVPAEVYANAAAHTFFSN